jgi:hypothetical protein
MAGLGFAEPAISINRAMPFTAAILTKPGQTHKSIECHIILTKSPISSYNQQDHILLE